MRKVAIFALLALLAGNFCFVNSANASSSAADNSLECKNNIASLKTPECSPAYQSRATENSKKHDNKILNFHIGGFKGNENTIEKPPAWATTRENDYSFSLQIRIPFL